MAGVDDAHRPFASRDQPVHQRRHATQVADEHGHAAGQVVAYLLDPVDVVRVGAVPTGHHVGDGQQGVGRDEGVRFDEVGLGEDRQGVQTGVVGGDEPWSMSRGRGSGSTSADTTTGTVRVRDDDPLDGVRIVGAAPQRRLPRLDADDAGQRVRAAAGVATEATSSPTTTLLRPSSRARIAVIIRSSMPPPAASRTAYRPRSTPVTKPGTASS